MRGTEPDTHEEGAAPRRVLGLFSSQWRSVVLHEPHAFHGGTRRTDESERGLPDISEKVLAQTLREMERGGPLSRRVFGVVPPRAGCSLTPLGCEFIGPVEMLHEWGRVYANALDSSRPRPRSRRRRSTPSGSG